jgi:hypothetical protein
MAREKPEKPVLMDGEAEKSFLRTLPRFTRFANLPCCLLLLFVPPRRNTKATQKYLSLALIGRLETRLVSSNISLLLVSLSSYSFLFLLLLLFFEGCSVVSEIHSDIFFFARVSLTRAVVDCVRADLLHLFFFFSFSLLKEKKIFKDF